MDWLAHNAGFVLAAYIISGVCIAALIIAVIVTDRRRAKALKNQKN
jgi:heme exporter protein CcmD